MSGWSIMSINHFIMKKLYYIFEALPRTPSGGGTTRSDLSSFLAGRTTFTWHFLPPTFPPGVHEPFSFTHRRLLTLFTLPAGREKDGEGVAGWIREGRWNCQCCIGPPRVKTGHGSSVITSLPESFPADNGECTLSLSLFLSCHTGAVARILFLRAIEFSAK